MAGSMDPIIYYLWRAMTRLLCLLVIAAALALPASALAQGNAFGPLPPADTPVPTVAPSDNTSTQQDEGTGQTTLLLIGGGLVLLFAVIATVITRDARR